MGPTGIRGNTMVRFSREDSHEEDSGFQFSVPKVENAKFLSYVKIHISEKQDPLIAKNKS